jgi:hypothetical protein
MNHLKSFAILLICWPFTGCTDAGQSSRIHQVKVILERLPDHLLLHEREHQFLYLASAKSAQRFTDEEITVAAEELLSDARAKGSTFSRIRTACNVAILMCIIYEVPKEHTFPVSIEGGLLRFSVQSDADFTIQGNDANGTPFVRFGRRDLSTVVLPWTP